MAYTPTTEEGKKAIAEGADPSVVEQMEKDGDIATLDNKEKKTPEKSEEELAAEKAAAEAEAQKKAKESGTDDDDEEEEEDDEENRQPNRSPKYMPAWKAKELAKEAAEKAKAEAQAEFDIKLKELGSKPGGASGEDVTKFADEFGLTPEVASSMIDRMATIIESRVGVNEIKKDLELRKANDARAAEEQGFVNEWESKETQEAIKNAAGNNEITAEVKDKIKKLAYTTTYARYRLPDIIRLESARL